MLGLLPKSTHSKFLLVLLVGTILLYHGQLTFQDRLSPDPSFAAEGHVLAGERGETTDGHSGAADYLAILFLISGWILRLLLKGVRKLRKAIAFRHAGRRLPINPRCPRGPTASFLQVFRL